MIKETTSKLHLFYYAYILSFNQFLLYVSLKLISVPRKWSWNHGSLNVFLLPVILICICWDQAAPSPQLFYIVWNNSSEFFLFWESPPSKQIFFIHLRTEMNTYVNMNSTVCDSTNKWILEVGLTFQLSSNLWASTSLTDSRFSNIITASLGFLRHLFLRESFISFSISKLCIATDVYEHEPCFWAWDIGISWRNTLRWWQYPVLHLDSVIKIRNTFVLISDKHHLYANEWLMTEN